MNHVGTEVSTRSDSYQAGRSVTRRYRSRY